MLANGNMDKDMEEEGNIGVMDLCLKVTGKITLLMERVA